MRLRTISTLFIFALGTVACGNPHDSESTDEIPYDATNQNFMVQGSYSGLALDLSMVAVAEFRAERQYRGPHMAGTDPDDEIPDFSKAELCEIEFEAPATVDGNEWAIEIQLENFQPGMGPGRYEVIGPDETTGPKQLSFEFQMERDDIKYEKTAIAGYVDIKTVTSTGTHEEGADVLLGGSFGATYELDFGPNESLDGSFHLEFNAVDVEGSPCD